MISLPRKHQQIEPTAASTTHGETEPAALREAARACINDVWERCRAEIDACTGSMSLSGSWELGCECDLNV